METIRAIIINDLPKDTNGNPRVFQQTIQRFYFGDTDISGAESPSVIMIASPTETKDLAFGTKELTHKIKMSCYNMNSDVEVSNRASLEMGRLIYEALLPHRLMWVMAPCPICQFKILTPAHFVLVHSSLLATYLTAAQTSFNNTWAETHLSGDTAPTLPNSGLGADAYLAMCADVNNNVTVAGLSDSAKNQIKKNFEKLRRPIHLMYDVALSDVQPEPLGKELLHTATFTLTAKELIRQPAYGPDNVPTGTFALQPRP